MSQSKNNKIWEQYFLISQEEVQEIICLLYQGELPQKDIAEQLKKRLGISPSTTYNRLRDMYQAGLLFRDGNRRDGFIFRLKKFSIPEVTPEFIMEMKKRPVAVQL